MIPRFKLHHQRLHFCTISCYPSSPFRSQQSANDFISRLCKQKRFQEALRAFDFLHALSPSFQLYPSTYAHLFSVCSHLLSLRHGRRVHLHLSDSGIPPDVILHNHILSMYGKCGSLNDACRVFDQMPERNLVSWTSMISGYGQNRREYEAVRMYVRMLRSGLLPDQFALGSAVRACAGLLDVELGRQLHAHALKSDHGSNLIVQNALITMFSKTGRIDDASVVFVKIWNKDTISWGAMIAGFAQHGRELDALEHFKEMIGRGVQCRPNEFHLGSAFSACGSLTQLEYGEQMHGLCLKYGLEGDSYAGCSLTDMYARCKRLDSAQKAFYQIAKPDIVAWNSMINAYSHDGLINEAMMLFCDMRDYGFKPDDITIMCLLCACADSTALCQGHSLHSYLVKAGLNVDTSVCNSLLSMYTRCSGFATALHLFHEMSHQDLVSWNTILTACVQHQQLAELFQLLNLMRTSVTKLDQISLNTILNASAESGYLDMAKQVHSYSLKVGLEDDLMVNNGLIDTYAKCGSLDDARKVFDIMGNICDVFSWSSLIVAYAQFGYAKESIELFAQMQSLGIKPNHVTFVGVLSACSRVGSVDEGLYYYRIMESEYGIIPTREHCSCVIDLLARAGRLNDALRFVDQMPFDPDIIMWKALLAACKMQNNLEVGKMVAEEIMKTDASNSAAYVLLCNIYASSGCWDEFARIRKMMKSSGARKSPGKSWIKVKGELRVFIVEDRSHPETQDMYTMLELLGMEVVEIDHEPELPCQHGGLDFPTTELVV